MNDKKNVSGEGYESFVKAFREKRIDWGGPNRVLVTDERDMTTAYMCLCDGRLKIPAACYDDKNDNPAILGNRNRWESVEGSDPRSRIMVCFGLDKLDLSVLFGNAPSR